MKVIFKKEVSRLGRLGEVKQVARGFARNYLLPRGLALEATTDNLAWWDREKAVQESRQNQALEQAKKDAVRLQETRLSFSRSVGAGEKLFGSVGKADIAKSLKALGFEIEKTSVLLEHPLKSVGDYEVGVRLHSEVQVQVRVSVVPRK